MPVVTDPADINEVRISGHVIGGPMHKQTITGSLLATFLVQTIRIYEAKGKRREDVEHHFVVAWDALAHRLSGLRPGHRISVFGRIQTHSFTDKTTGVKQRKTEILAENIVLHHDSLGTQP